MVLDQISVKLNVNSFTNNCGFKMVLDQISVKQANANAYLKISTFNNDILRHQGTINELQDLFIHCGKYNDLRAKYEKLDINVVGGYNPYGLGCSVGNNKNENEIYINI